LCEIKSCRSLSLTYWDVIVGYFEEEMDLFINYILVTLGKSCRCRETLPSFRHFIRILVIKYENEKQIKQNEFVLKKIVFEETVLTNK